MCVVVDRRIVERGIDRPKLRNGRFNGGAEIVIMAKSHWIAAAVPPDARIESAVSSNTDGVSPTTATLAPSRAAIRAVAEPILGPTRQRT